MTYKFIVRNVAAKQATNDAAIREEFGITKRDPLVNLSLFFWS